MLYLDHKKSHNHNPLSFNKILNPKEKQSQEYAPYRLIRVILELRIDFGE